jgi:hypothetical protein
MELKNYLEKGLTPDAYAQLLGEKRDLHDLHYRRAKIDGEAVARLRRTVPHRVLVITEPWCGDSLAILPVVVKLFGEVGRSDIRIVRRDENHDLMDRYLTRGARAVPIVIVLDQDYQERCHWGPRPHAAQEIFELHRGDLRAGRIDKTDVFKQIRAFYAKDRGTSIVHELVDLVNANADHAL